jgi:hypothetical protein
VKAILINFFLLTALLSLMSCSAGKQDVSLKVSAAFTLGSAGYTGGLIAYGENSSGGRFSIAAGSGQTLSVTLANGSWDIYVMGWEEVNGRKFRGTKYCGKTSVNLAADDKDINVTIKPENCLLADFQDEASVQNLLISSCGGFYQYNSASNSFSPITAATSDTFCSSLPTSLSYRMPYYKLVSTNISGNQSTPGISSECIATDPATSDRLAVPTEKFPWVVRMYRSLKDCQLANSTLFERFAFPNGLSQGNQSSFDQHLMVNAAGEGSLFLPSGKTRRGYSPFMAQQPRILCGTSPSLVDCFAAPDAASMSSPFSPSEKVNADVRWENSFYNDHTPTLIKGFKTSNVETPCDAATMSFLSSSPYFNVHSCNIEQGNLKADFSRNALTCRGSGDINGIISMYERNDKIFLLRQYVDTLIYFKIYVYSKSGTLETYIPVPHIPSQTFKSMTVDQLGRVYVLMNTLSPARTLYRFIYNPGNKQYVLDTTQTSGTFPVFQNAEKIESIDNDTMVVADSTDLRGIKVATPGTPGSALAITNNYLQLLFKDGVLFVLNGVTGNIHKVGVDTLTLNLASGGTITPPLTSSSFHISSVGTARFIYFHPSNSGNASIYALNAANNLDGQAAQFSTSGFGFGSLMVEGKIYTLNGATVDTATFAAWKFEPGVSIANSVQNSVPNICESQLTATIDAIPYKLNVSSRNNQNVKMAFEEAFRGIGNRSVFNQASTQYFESLQSDDDDDQGRSEGLLGRGSSMMGPDGLGGVVNGLYPNMSCSQLKTAAGSTGLSKTFTLMDNIKGETRTYSLNITVPTDYMHDFVCPTGPCTDRYDLALEISAPGDEKTKLQISCTAKIGAIESADLHDGELRHELTIWNTVAETTARYENYQIEDRIESGVVKKRINISTLRKSDSNNLVHRYVEINRTPSNIEGRVSETGVASLNLSTSSLHTMNLSIGDFNLSNTNLSNGVQIGDVIGNTKLVDDQATAGVCTQVTNTNPLGSDVGCANINHAITQASLGGTLFFNLESLKVYTDGTGASAPFYNLFSLQP